MAVPFFAVLPPPRETTSPPAPSRRPAPRNYPQPLGSHRVASHISSFPHPSIIILLTLSISSSGSLDSSLRTTVLARVASSVVEEGHHGCVKRVAEEEPRIHVSRLHETRHHVHFFAIIIVTTTTTKCHQVPRSHRKQKSRNMTHHSKTPKAVNAPSLPC